MDGLEAAEVLTRELDVPVVFLTAQVNEEHFRRALLASPHPCLRKPFGKADLEQVISEALDSVHGSAEEQEASR
jgi:CheY-like chemotaxis protein